MGFNVIYDDLMGFNGDLRRSYGDSMVYSWDLPSGKTLCELEHGTVESSLIYP